MSVIFRKEQIQQSITNENRKEGNVSQQGQPLLIVAGFEIWIATKLNILFCNGYNAPTLS
jgi:hypothetical protein